MKLKVFGLLVAGLLALPSAGHAALVTISGQGAADGSWNVTTVTGTSVPAGYSSQVWWGDSNLASAFAQSLAGGLGYPNTGYDVVYQPFGTFAPFFAWQILTTAVGPVFDARTMQNGGGLVGFQDWNRNITYTFAVAERATVSPPPVPLPAAAWLLLSGLGGLGFLGRRRKAA